MRAFAARRHSSAAKRVLPMPASPETSTAAAPVDVLRHVPVDLAAAAHEGAVEHGLRARSAGSELRPPRRFCDARLFVSVGLGPTATRAGERQIERRLLEQHRTFHVDEISARTDTELLVEERVELAVRAQRLGLTPAAVQREHELAPEPLAQRVHADERLELREQGSVPSECEVRIDAGFDRPELQTREPGDLDAWPRMRLRTRPVRRRATGSALPGARSRRATDRSDRPPRRTAPCVRSGSASISSGSTSRR